MVRLSTIGRVVHTSLFVHEVKKSSIYFTCEPKQKCGHVLLWLINNTFFWLMLNDFANAADIVAIDNVASSIVSIHNGFLLQCKTQSDLTQWC